MRIPDIHAGKIRAGVIAEERIPKTLETLTIHTAKIPGTLTLAGGKLGVQNGEDNQRVLWSTPENINLDFWGGDYKYASLHRQTIRFDPLQNVVIGKGGLAVEGPTTVSGYLAAQRFRGRGSDITDLNASHVNHGVLDGSLIGSMDASKITTGILDPLRIPKICADVIVGGTLQTSVIPPLDASHIQTGVLREALIPRGIPLDASQIVGGTLDPSRIPALDASKIGTGIFHIARIPNLHGSKIIRGTLGPEQIPGLDASKITSGIIHPNHLPPPDLGPVPLHRIPGLPASHINSGTLNPDRLPPIRIDGSHVITGTIDPKRLPPLDASMITRGTLSSERIPMLHASYISYGQIHPHRLPPLNASMIVGGVLDKAVLPPGNAADIVKGVFNIGRIPDLDASKITSGIIRPELLPYNIGKGVVSVALEDDGRSVVKVRAPMYIISDPEDDQGGNNNTPIKNALEKVTKMRGVITRRGIPGLDLVGDAFPEATSTSSEGINYNGIIPLLVESIRQLAEYQRRDAIGENVPT